MASCSPAPPRAGMPMAAAGSARIQRAGRVRGRRRALRLGQAGRRRHRRRRGRGRADPRAAGGVAADALNVGREAAARNLGRRFSAGVVDASAAMQGSWRPMGEPARSRAARMSAQCASSSNDSTARLARNCSTRCVSTAEPLTYPTGHCCRSSSQTEGPEQTDSGPSAFQILVNGLPPPLRRVGERSWATSRPCTAYGGGPRPAKT